jgi:hypothetical protein
MGGVMSGASMMAYSAPKAASTPVAAAAPAASTATDFTSQIQSLLKTIESSSQSPVNGAGGLLNTYG